MSNDPITVNLTPMGAMTPEGCQRIAKAQDGLHDAITRCAEQLRELLDNASDRHLVNALVRNDTDRTDAEDQIQQARAAIQGWTDASEAFIRAVAGRPPLA